MAEITTVAEVTLELCRSVLAEYPDRAIAIALPLFIFPRRYERTPACTSTPGDRRNACGPILVLTPSRYGVYVHTWAGSGWEITADRMLEYPAGGRGGEKFRSELAAVVAARLAQMATAATAAEEAT